MLFGRLGEQVVARTDGDAPAPGRMFVNGRVLDPGGKPVAGATIIAYARGKIRRRSLVLLSPAAIGEARSDESGRFRLDAARTGSSQHDSVGAIATAPGFGAAWVELDPDAEKPQADITLLPEQVHPGPATRCSGASRAGRRARRQRDESRRPIDSRTATGRIRRRAVGIDPRKDSCPAGRSLRSQLPMAASPCVESAGDFGSRSELTTHDLLCNPSRSTRMVLRGPSN